MNAFVRYLGSNKNIVGAAAALAGLAVTVPTGIAGPLWPVVVGGLYGIGALLTPREKVHLTIEGNAQAQAEELQKDLRDLKYNIGKKRSRLPAVAAALLDEILLSLDEILDRAAQLASSPEQLFVVGRMIRDYIPTSLESYLNLPTRYATSHRGPAGKTPQEDLIEQLQLLRSEVGKVAEAVYAGDAQALRNQGRFLQEKFGSSALDL
ncbi:hypothetical protein [Kribbia dieselivorans]|uniref:hypothetical protein n=1 Tax=Kribbia dieselivorans TaxID=331526 RepID=UPI000838E3EF|nr:hypothetical protein [Kribbia dieselivorans]